VADRNRLRGLAKTHVVGQEQTPVHQRALDAIALVGVERLLQRAQRITQALPRPSGLTLAREPRALL
jgi:hypothetical protein